MVCFAGQPTFAGQLIDALARFKVEALNCATSMASMRTKSTLCGQRWKEGSDGEDAIENQTVTSGKID
jgi:hypothetical protein